jgi:hypothetical protein
VQNIDLIFNPLSKDFKFDYEDGFFKSNRLQILQLHKLFISGGFDIQNEETRFFVKQAEIDQFFKDDNFLRYRRCLNDDVRRYDIAVKHGL